MKLKRDYPNSATGVEFFRKIFKFKKSKRDWSWYVHVVDKT